MVPNDDVPPSARNETFAETLILLSTDETGRIPFPEGSYREIASFLDALTRLTEKGHVDHRFDHGHLGCYLNESGKLLRSRIVAARQLADGPVAGDHDDAVSALVHQRHA